MKTLALGTLLSLLVVGTAFHAIAQSVEEQRSRGVPGAVEKQRSGEAPGGVEKRGDSNAPPSAPATSAQAEICKTDIVAVSGRSKYRPFSKDKELQGLGQAMVDAVAAWQREVGGKLGERWKLWSKARDRSFDCTPTEGKIPSSSITCTIRGRPCEFDALAAGEPVTADDDGPRPDPQTGAADVEKQDGRDTARCHGIVAAVGSEQTSKEKAMAAAHDAWIARVRFDFGERYTDLNNSVDASSVCTLSSKAPFLKSVRFRCKIWAMPCPAPTTGEWLQRRYEEEEE